jgi:hypothetical protein
VGQQLPEHAVVVAADSVALDGDEAVDLVAAPAICREPFEEAPRVLLFDGVGQRDDEAALAAEVVPDRGLVLARLRLDGLTSTRRAAASTRFAVGGSSALGSSMGGDPVAASARAVCPAFRRSGFQPVFLGVLGMPGL